MIEKKHLYILVFTITLLILVQFGIQKVITNIKNDTQFIDIVEKQKTIVDKINTIVLRLHKSEDSKETEINYNELVNAKDTWQKSQENIKFGNASLDLKINNSPEMIYLFAMTEKPFQSILKEIQVIEKENLKTITDKSFLIPIQKTISENKIEYLEYSDEIVTQYKKESKEFIKKLEFLETAILFIAFGVLMIEWKVVFRPIKKKNINSRRDLRTS